MSDLYTSLSSASPLASSQREEEEEDEGRMEGGTQLMQESVVSEENERGEDVEHVGSRVEGMEREREEMMMEMRKEEKRKRKQLREKAKKKFVSQANHLKRLQEV